MSEYPANAKIHVGDWNSASDENPAMKWMHEYTNAYDSGKRMWPEYLSSDFQYAKSTGEIFPKGEASYDAVDATYQFFTKYYHEPYFFVYWDRKEGDGWEMTGNAWVYANLPNGSGKGIKDAQGRDWEMKVPGGFHFMYKKDSSAPHGGIKMSSMAITSDSGPVVVELLKRGVMTPKDLGL